MNKRLSDEDVERIADAVARRIKPVPPTQIGPIWIDPRVYQPTHPWWTITGTASASADIKGYLVNR